MDLLDLLLGYLGKQELARRVGVKPATIDRWLRDGPSQAGGERLARAAKRFEASRRGWETRKRNIAARLGFSEPERNELTPTEALPTKAPPRRRRKRSKRFDSKWSWGRETWIYFEAPVAEIDPVEIGEEAFAILERTDFTYVAMKFIFWRYIPFNPSYQGEMVKKQGTWQIQVYWTPARSTELDLRREATKVMDLAQGWAETRIIVLESVGVHTFNRKSEI